MSSHNFDNLSLMFVRIYILKFYFRYEIKSEVAKPWHRFYS